MKKYFFFSLSKSFLNAAASTMAQADGWKIDIGETRYKKWTFEITCEKLSIRSECIEHSKIFVNIQIMVCNSSTMAQATVWEIEKVETQYKRWTFETTCEHSKKKYSNKKHSIEKSLKNISNYLWTSEL